ncbi:MAG: alanine dehydrogenase [Anaerolineae bacterium]|nr:alanine dehydrogenase [Anaerolineae bacterium]
MIIGIPKEIKKDEYRIALPPNAVGELIRRGHTVYVQAGAGQGSAFPDEEYVQVGATIVPTAEDAWNKAEMVVKVKEPQAQEFAFMRRDLVLFTYLHLAAAEELTHKMVESGVTGIAYETVTDEHGKLPLLEPMSEVAGRMSVQVVSHYLEKTQGGRGVLLGGIPGVKPAHIVILGGGTVGTNAAKMALGMGAQVTLLDINIERLRYLDDTMHGRFNTLYSNAANIADVIKTADAVIGAVLIIGAKAPHLIRRDMLKTMPEGSVIVDVAVDVLHYGVANMPGAVPRTSSLGLSNATLRYVLKIADLGAMEAMRADPGLMKGLNIHHGHVTHPAVAETFNLPATDVQSVVMGQLTH